MAPEPPDPPTGSGETWEAANGAFLAAALEWLRRLASAHSTASARGSAGKAADDQVAQAEAAMRQAAAMSPPPALVGLAERLGLSPFEQDTLLLCSATELDPSFASLLAAAHGNERMPYPTFALALSLLPAPSWDVLSPHWGLRYWRLIEINQPPGQPLITSALRADERIVSYVKGMNYLDDRLEPLIGLIDPGGLALPASQQAVADEIARQWRRASGIGPVVQLAGADDSSKRLVAAHAAAACGLTAYRLPTALLPAQAGELDNLARLWQREALLLPLGLYLDAGDTAAAGQGPAQDEPSVARFLSRVEAPVLFAARESWPDLGRSSVVLDVEPPTSAERAAAWRAELGVNADDAFIDSLAGQFALDVPAIHDVANLANRVPTSVWGTCRALTRPRLDTLAQRLVPRVTWDDIVLPDSELKPLREIGDQVAHRSTVYETWGFGERITRGLGVSVLFSGPSGTGKTMAAEILAGHLRLDLYRIDLSAVVNKYIGETEKNLRRLFDAAEGGGAALFFDEADALFGKRSEVRDSHDRYANIEINYLLQRMESYRGLAILATNMRNALDTAFLRRLRFVVTFPFPGVAERRAIWQKAFPAQAPHGRLDFDRLAELQVSGGMIRNIALNAAFLAAAAGTDITMPLVLGAAQTEFRKLELPIRKRDFVWDEPSEAGAVGRPA
jgi:ATPase family protein associated with various cellular activities (AAA)/winged helix domain-containing protein